MVARTAFEYSQVRSYRDTTVRGVWPVKTVWYGPSGEQVDLPDEEDILNVLTRYGRDGWMLVGTPEVEKGYVYPLHTQDEQGNQFTNSASAWLVKKWWLIREVQSS